VKLGAELREEAMEEDWTGGSGCGGRGAEGGSGAAGDSLVGLATGSEAGGAIGSLNRVIDQLADHSIIRPRTVWDRQPHRRQC